MLQDLTIWGAFFAGVLSFVSPCVLPLVPPYLGFLAGVSLDQLTGEGEEGAESAKMRVFFASLTFVLGFSTVFVILGASASLIGQFVTQYLDVLGYVAGAIIIIMGLHFLGVFRIALLYREARVNVQRKPAGPIGSYLFGVAFGFGWTPCIGPILAAILAVAGSEDTVGQGALLLASYSLGIGAPFMGAALFAGPFLRFMQGFRKHMGKVEKAMGAVLVVTGVAFLTGQMANFSYWLLEAFPALSQFG
ncbi:MAG: cytochrome c biogenesis protein CcdA [Stappiaceae bacterium]